MSTVDTDGNATFFTSLVSGGVAGLSVDLALFPLDTVKTRLQSEKGFWKSGGFRGIYSGIGSVSVGSMPGAALFFTSYEFVKSCFHDKQLSASGFAGVHMMAASVGEVMACLIRVPTEVVKSRAQTNSKLTSFKILKQAISSEGFSGLYRGYFSTVMREIPFSLIQFPTWEYLKYTWRKKNNGTLHAWQSSLCGAFAGGISAGITTPFDVAKTRIMLAETDSKLASGNILNAMSTVKKEKGLKGLFAGVVPRMLWISVGGAIFLGIYDKAKMILS